ncbi:sodium:solute symporter family transporter [Roseiconus nitratireducens]|nr:hypothetical protein [Roseiconus nitratireducens]
MMHEASNSALIAFVIYTIAVFALAVLSNRYARGKEFVGEYFLGSRGFGVWAFALTFAATNASGGSFMGFPALIYTHGWSLAFWISGFMVLPLLSMGLIGKRINQVARHCDAVTIPEILGARYGSKQVGLVATALLVLFMFFYLLAQFKAGGKILSVLLADEPAFQSLSAGVSRISTNLPWINQASGDYLVCLVVFSVAVIVYVVYGGFRAVVWTDVMQGIVMFVGVVLMLVLALRQIGGLESATRQMARMTPPEHGQATVRSDPPAAEEIVLPKGTWIKQSGTAFRLAKLTVIPRGRASAANVPVLIITTPEENDKLRSDDVIGELERDFGIALSLSIQERTPYASGAGQAGVYLTNPGPSVTGEFGFLAIGTAISFFIFWPFGATGQPANMVRLMAFKSSRTLRVSIVTVSVYYAVIYLSLVVIFCCGRVLLPGMEIDPDRTMPDLATRLTANAGVPWMAGLLVAAPFAAVMSSVDSFLLLLSSSVVRDIYQQHIHPGAPERTLKRLSYAVTLVVGVIAVLMVVNPPTYLQDLIVFASGGLAACFLVPMVLTLYWSRMTSSGTIAGMLGGTLMHLGLTCWGYIAAGQFRAYEFLGLNPFLWDLAASFIAAIGVSLLGRTNPLRTDRFFPNQA